jgi:molybdopterin converting factor subunit 1
MKSSPDEICVSVKFFAAPREAMGTNEIDVKLAAGSRVSDLVEYLVETYPVLRAHARFLSVSVNRTYVSMQTELTDGDEVACLPPVGGG